jgi:DNA-binding MarR family transcriptional regulator
VGFLLSQLGFLVSARFTALLEAVELDPRQFALLRAIAANEGLAQNALAEALSIPASSMVGVVDDLEGRGLIERRPDVSDRRVRMLYLTDPGRAAVDRGFQVVAAMEDLVCAGLSADRRRTLISTLRRVGANLGIVTGVHPGLAQRDAPPGDGG